LSQTSPSAAPASTDPTSAEPAHDAPNSSPRNPIEEEETAGAAKPSEEKPSEETKPEEEAKPAAEVKSQEDAEPAKDPGQETDAYKLRCKKTIAEDLKALMDKGVPQEDVKSFGLLYQAYDETRDGVLVGEERDRAMPEIERACAELDASSNRGELLQEANELSFEVTDPASLLSFVKAGPPTNNGGAADTKGAQGADAVEDPLPILTLTDAELSSSLDILKAEGFPAELVTDYGLLVQAYDDVSDEKLTGQSLDAAMPAIEKVVDKLKVSEHLQALTEKSESLNFAETDPEEMLKLIKQVHELEHASVAGTWADIK